jgi:hypothetical protein
MSQEKVNLQNESELALTMSNFGQISPELLILVNQRFFCAPMENGGHHDGIAGARSLHTRPFSWSYASRRILGGKM